MEIAGERRPEGGPEAEKRKREEIMRKKGMKEFKNTHDDTH